eukprot:756726-Hanusia_phi.AAC.3
MQEAVRAQGFCWSFYGSIQLSGHEEVTGLPLQLWSAPFKFRWRPLGRELDSRTWRALELSCSLARGEGRDRNCQSTPRRRRGCLRETSRHTCVDPGSCRLVPRGPASPA